MEIRSFGRRGACLTGGPGFRGEVFGAIGNEGCWQWKEQDDSLRKT